MQFENQKSQIFEIPKNAHYVRFSGSRKTHIYPLTLIFWKSRKTHIYVVFRDFKKNPEKRTFTPYHLDL